MALYLIVYDINTPSEEVLIQDHVQYDNYEHYVNSKNNNRKALTSLLDDQQWKMLSKSSYICNVDSTSCQTIYRQCQDFIDNYDSLYVFCLKATFGHHPDPLVEDWISRQIFGSPFRG